MIHKVLRVGNLVWLLFSAIMVECTLNFNHIGGVLGGMGRENTLSLPGQLLPFLVGLLGFTRLCYSIFIEKYLNAQPRDVSALTAAIEASLQPAVVGARVDTGLGPGAGPGAAADQKQVSEGTSEDIAPVESTRQPPELERSWAVRYLVAWLPWLSLLHNYDQELLEQGISRHGTGFDSVLASPTSAVVSAFSPLASPTAVARKPTLE